MMTLRPLLVAGCALALAGSMSAQARSGGGDQTAGVVVRQIWADAPGGVWTIAVSPNGRHLAYAGPGHAPRRRALYVRDLLSAVNRPLTNEDPTGFVVSVTFSPDSRMVAYTWYNGVRDDQRLIMLDGSAAPPFPYRHDEWPHSALVGWSPDGRQMLVAVKTGPLDRQTLHIGLMSVADGSMQILKTFTLKYFPSIGGFSSDGRYVTYDHPARGDSGERDIFILGTNGGQDVPLVARAADDHNPRFTPDGSGVVFFSSRVPGEPIGAWYQRVVDGRPQGSPELLKPDMGPTAQPIGFTSSGSLFYHTGNEPITNADRPMRTLWVMGNFLPKADAARTPR